MDLVNRTELEQSFTAKLEVLNEKFREELKKQMGGSLDPSKITPEFWQQVETEYQHEMNNLLLVIYLISADMHVTGAGYDATGLRQTFTQRGEAWAEQESTDLARRFVENSQKQLAGLNSSEPELPRYQLPGQSEPQVKTEPPELTLPEKKEKVAKVFSKERAENIAITGTTDAGSAGAEAGVIHTVGISDNDKWTTEQDGKVCPVCMPLNGTTRRTWARFFPSGPPGHPRCRCWITYAHEQVDVDEPVLSGTGAT